MPTTLKMSSSCCLSERPGNRGLACRERECRMVMYAHTNVCCVHACMCMCTQVHVCLYTSLSVCACVCGGGELVSLTHLRLWSSPKMHPTLQISIALLYGAWRSTSGARYHCVTTCKDRHMYIHTHIHTHMCTHMPKTYTASRNDRVANPCPMKTPQHAHFHTNATSEVQQITQLKTSSEF